MWFIDSYVCVCLHAVIYPSSIHEWQSVESFTRKFVILHREVGEIIYACILASTLAKQGIYFYDAHYVVPKGKKEQGIVQTTPVPSFDQMDWPCLYPFMVGS